MAEQSVVDCSACYDKQLLRVAEYCHLEDTALDEMRAIKDEVLARFGDKPVTSVYMGDMLQRIAPIIGTDDPYAGIKAEYNQLVLDREAECLATIEQAADPFQLALRYAAAGNLIDFGAKHSFSRDDVTALLDRVPSLSFAIDESETLREEVHAARSILYIGDNCGEIVLDKLLIAQLHRENPDAEIVYGVRGGPVVNDITVIDAEQVGMERLARVLSSGLAIPGTLPEESSEEFRAAFYGADVVIAKGMGNYETLGPGCGRGNVYFLLMAKCELVAHALGSPLMALVCTCRQAGA